MKLQASKRGRIFRPDLREQLRIVAALLKLKHFDGIWYNDGTLTVRRFQDHMETPQYLPWEVAARMVETGELVERKPPTSLRDQAPDSRIKRSA